MLFTRSLGAKTLKTNIPSFTMLFTCSHVFPFQLSASNNQLVRMFQVAKLHHLKVRFSFLLSPSLSHSLAPITIIKLSFLPLSSQPPPQGEVFSSFSIFHHHHYPDHTIIFPIMIIMFVVTTITSS